MTFATDKQIALITRLATAKYGSVIEAADAYGLGLKSARDLHRDEASELIDFLLGKTVSGIDKNSSEFKAAEAKYDADRAAFEAKYGKL